MPKRQPAKAKSRATPRQQTRQQTKATPQGDSRRRQLKATAQGDSSRRQLKDDSSRTTAQGRQLKDDSSRATTQGETPSSRAPNPDPRQGREEQRTSPRQQRGPAITHPRASGQDLAQRREKPTPRAQSNTGRRHRPRPRPGPKAIERQRQHSKQSRRQATTPHPRQDPHNRARLPQRARPLNSKRVVQAPAAYAKRRSRKPQPPTHRNQPHRGVWGLGPQEKCEMTPSAQSADRVTPECSPEGIRTLATALRGRRPRPLDDGARTFSCCFHSRFSGGPNSIRCPAPPSSAGLVALGYQDSNLD